MSLPYNLGAGWVLLADQHNWIVRNTTRVTKRDDGRIEYREEYFYSTLGAAIRGWSERALRSYEEDLPESLRTLLFELEAMKEDFAEMYADLRPGSVGEAAQGLLEWSSDKEPAVVPQSANERRQNQNQVVRDGA